MSDMTIQTSLSEDQTQGSISASPVVEYHWLDELLDDDLELIWRSYSEVLQFDEHGVERDELGQSLDEFKAEYRMAAIDAPECYFITVDVRPHAKINAFLESLQTLRPSTQAAYARTLKELLTFAIDRDLFTADCDGSDSTADVFELSVSQYLAFRKANKHLSAASWNLKNGHCVAFYNFCNINFGTRMPFTLKAVQTKWGTVFSNGLNRRMKRQREGNAIAPEYVRLLLDSVSPIEIKDGLPVGTVPLFQTRDKALVAMALATGARRQTLRGTTHYEIPALSYDESGALLPFTLDWFTVPAATAKYDAGSDADVFSNHIRVVHEWIHERTNPLLHRPYAPADPIRLDPSKTGFDSWEGTDQHGGTVGGRWADTDLATRKRMVDVDGQSPLLFTNKDGKPLSKSYVSNVVSKAAKKARKSNPNFPKVRLHDLRHTYGTYLALYYQHIKDPNPIAMVSYSLGHMSPETTMTYTQALAAHRRSGRPIKDYLWGAK